MDSRTPGPRFATVLQAELSLPEHPGVDSLAQLIFGAVEGERDDEPVLLGVVGTESFDVSLRSLRHTVLLVTQWARGAGLSPGDTVCLIRLPRTSEMLVAVAYAALSAAGFRVLLPMYLEREHLSDWLKRSGAKAVLWSAVEVAGPEAHEADRALLDGLEVEVEHLGLPYYDLVRDLALTAALRRGYEASPDPEDPAVQAVGQGTDLQTECLLLTTSGTSGRAKLVRYRQGAFLRSCGAWEAAGLFTRYRQGGRALCVLFAHSMGLRAFWNAIWTRTPLCMIHPEWFAEHPARVQSLLQRMRPAHLTGGPAVVRTLLELARVFPQLKEDCYRDLRCVVSSGATFAGDAGRRISVSLGVDLHNAFGMTETMQVVSTLAPGPFYEKPPALGNLLPGVRLGLEPAPGQPEDVYRMHVRSPYGFAGYLDEEGGSGLDADGWFFTGDLVQYDGKSLWYVGREQADYINDGFGVKVARSRLETLYRDLGLPAHHLEFLPLKDEPGFAVLVFLAEGGTPGAADQGVTDPAVLHRVERVLESRNDRLFRELDDFEAQHLTVARFSCVEGEPPRTRKGGVRHAQLADEHAGLIRRLTGRYVKAEDVFRLDRARQAGSADRRHVLPKVGELLRIARLDKRYIAGKGDRIVYEESGDRVEVLDCVGGYGANLLGHNHPAIRQAAQEFLESDRIAVADQGSNRAESGALASLLSEILGRYTDASYVVRFGSTGAEAVEMALAHAALERERRVEHLIRDLRQTVGTRYPQEAREATQRIWGALRDTPPVVLALQGSFHGHSLGARSVLCDKKKREKLQSLMGLHAEFLPLDGDPAVTVDEAVARHEIPVEVPFLVDGRLVPRRWVLDGVIAAIAEPVLGEGGVREVPSTLLSRMGENRFPLIMDEIQAGLGRCGTFLASEGVNADYYLFAKALGGGIAKISAVAIERSRYVERFDLHYSSTFAGDAASSHVARRALEIIQRKRVPERARERGKALRARLVKLQETYPDVIQSIGGRGLMQGITLDPACLEDAVLLRNLARRDLLGHLAASWLLNRRGVRMLPTLSAPLTLRVEPSAFVLDADLDELYDALDALCRALRDADSYELLYPLVAEEQALTDEEPERATWQRIPITVQPPAEGAVRVAFLNHMVHPEQELAMVDPGIATFSKAARRALVHKLMALTELRPMLVSGENLFDDQVWFLTINIPGDVATMEMLHRSGERKEVVERIQEAVDLAAEHGCEVVALGAFTSILTLDGTAIHPPPGVHVTTGNSLTVATGALRLRQACTDAGLDPIPEDALLSVIGAGGNIGAGLAIHLTRGASRFRRVMLVGRNRQRLETTRERLLAHWQEHHSAESAPEVLVSTALGDLARADVLAIAINTNEPLVYAQHLKAEGPVIIADISTPSAVSKEARRLPHVRVVRLAGQVTVPGAPFFIMSSQSPMGMAYCCAAEAMILGLRREETRSLALVGPVRPESVQSLDELAQRCGFFEHVEGGGYR